MIENQILDDATQLLREATRRANDTGGSRSERYMLAQGFVQAYVGLKQVQTLERLTAAMKKLEQRIESATRTLPGPF